MAYYEWLTTNGFLGGAANGPVATPYSNCSVPTGFPVYGVTISQTPNIQFPTHCQFQMVMI